MFYRLTKKENPLNKKKTFKSETRRSLPKHETPSYRIAEHTADYLTDTELLSLLLKSKNGVERSLQAAQELIISCGSLHSLMTMTLAELKRFPGIGESGAVAILGALEIARRLRKSDPSVHPILSSPVVVAEHMQPVIGHLQQEEFHVLLLGSKNQLIRDCMITRGLIDRSLVHAREIFRPALQEPCVRIILAHNHPSGDTTPSQEDISATKNLVDAGKLIGIDVLDHVIIGKQTPQRASYWCSMKDQGFV